MNKKGNKHCRSIVIGSRYDFFKKELLDKLSELDMFVTVHFGASDELAKSVENGKTHLLIGTNKYDRYPHSKM